ncbi:uncharacterized protein LOC121376454 [Gigantopelta aegis]|uniref:uncharacterized protein LOC121376454 n=1 Tax=Gigantopelta aegis TaxID=1735272 RepID=UPI001B88E618|nr:uncharacterized protein LOC121376454 [Gigantopelta aegis]
MTEPIQTDYPDTDCTIDDDSEPELDDFCRECDALYNKLVDVNVTATYRGKKFKKDSRTWLHKNRKDDADIDIDRDELDTGTDKYLDEDGYEFAYSVIDKNGRRFKKDSRVWLHKMSKATERQQRDENTSCDQYLDEASLTAISQITIGRYGREKMEKIGKKCIGYFRAGFVEKMITAGLHRTRKRRKLGASAPLCVIGANDLNVRRVPTCAFAHKHRRSELMFSAISESGEDNLSDSSNRASRSSSQASLDEVDASNSADGSRHISNSADDLSRGSRQIKSGSLLGWDGDNSPLTSEGCYDLAADSRIKAARFVLSCSDSKLSELHEDDSASGDSGDELPSGSRLELSRTRSDVSDKQRDVIAELIRNCTP